MSKAAQKVDKAVFAEFDKGIAFLVPFCPVSEQAGGADDGEGA